jgi:hypothetical protein
MGKKIKLGKLERVLLKQPRELRRQKITFFDLINEYTDVRKCHSRKPLSRADLNIFKEWAEEYHIFIKSHLRGHGHSQGRNYTPPHIHIDITGRRKHGKIHYIVDLDN